MQAWVCVWSVDELKSGPGAVKRGMDRPEMVQTGGCPGLSLEPFSWPVARLVLTPACPGPNSAHHEQLPPHFQELPHLLPQEQRTGEGHYWAVLFLLILPTFAYQRDSLQIIDPRYTPEDNQGLSQGPFPSGHGHCLISEQPPSQPTSLAPPTGACPCLSDHHCVSVPCTGLPGHPMLESC